MRQMVNTVNLVTSTNHDTTYYLVVVTSPAKLVRLVDYLNTYPLFTTKRLNFVDF